MNHTAISAGDTAWVLVSTALVLLMVPGLALFYGGLVRTRAVLNTFMMSVAALAVVGVQWVFAGYSLAFGPGRVIGSLSWAGLFGVGAGAGPYSATIPHLAFAGFQAMFAGITVALISGAMVERIRFHVYVVFALLWTTFVYDPLARIGLRGRHRRAHQRRYCLPRRRGDARPAPRFRTDDAEATQRRVHAHGRRSALGGLARIQRRIVARRGWDCRTRAREHTRGGGGGALGLVGDRLPARRSGDGGGRGDGRSGRARGNYAGGGVCVAAVGDRHRSSRCVR